MKIKEMFEKYKIQYLEKEISQRILELFPNTDIVDFLACMGRNIEFYKSPSGVARTTLYSTDNILEEMLCEPNKPCIDHGYLIIGSGCNGDYLCVNIETGLLGYVFSDCMWEELYDDFSDIYVELQMKIAEFIAFVMEDREHYPSDGAMAEQYIQKHSLKEHSPVNLPQLF